MQLSVRRISPILLFFCFALLLSSFASTRSQEKSQELRHEVAVTLKLIQVYVTDKRGNPVLDLTKEDFIIRDNGKEKTITEFERHMLSLPSVEEKAKPEIVQETLLPAPRELMGRKFFLLFDFAYNNARGILKAKKAALHFIDTQLQPTDEVGLLSYSAIKSLTLHEYLTTDHKNVREVVDSFGAKEILGRAENLEEEYWRYVTGENPPDASRKGGVGGVEREPDKLWLVEKELSPEFKKFQAIQDSNIHAIHFVQKMKDFAKALRYIPGYKHIILFSSGIPYSLMYGIHQTSADVSKAPRDRWDTGNKLLQLRYEDMIKELAASNSTVYTLDTEDMGTMISINSRLRGGYTLQTMASSTGGKYFGDINSFEEHLEKIQDLTACYYVIGYYVDEKWDGKYHKLKVKVGRPGCEVHAQKGYFNPKLFSKYSKLEKMLHLVDLALSEKHVFQTPVGFPLVAVPCLIEEKTNVVLYSKIDRDNIKELSGKDVELVSIVFGNADDIIEIKREESDFSELPEGDIYYSSLLPLDPGAYKCRIVLRNLETGRGAVASSSVEVPKIPDSGVQLYPPLLLIPGKETPYFRSLFQVFPIQSEEYIPLVGELQQGTPSLYAALRCIWKEPQEPEIQISAWLEPGEGGEKIPLTFHVLSSQRQEEADVLFLEIEMPELKTGRYMMYLLAEDAVTGSSSRTKSGFSVRSSPPTRK